MTKPLTPTLQTLFAELIQQTENAGPAGSTYTRYRDGIAYHYAKIPVGSTRIDRFVGKAGDSAVEAQIANLKRGMAQARERRRLIAMLKGGGLAGPSRILGATLDAIAHAGLFEDGAVLVGTAAYMLMEPHVGRLLPAPSLMTADVDLATVNLALTADPAESMETILKRADPSYAPVPKLDMRKPASRFANEAGYFVDLVTQVRSRDDSNPVPLTGVEAGAAPLQHLAWLIEEPCRTVALWGSGVLVAVPQPARFAVHKLILAQRRPGVDRIKRTKDLNQAEAIMSALEEHDPFALEDALEDARAMRRDGWSDPIDRSLAELGRA